MEPVNLLIAMSGFDASQKDEIIDGFLENGVEIGNCHVAHTKMGIFHTYREHSEINVILVSEFLEQSSPFQAEDINELDELSKDLRVIPILMPEHKGTDFMRQLYADAVYDAIFDADADIEHVSQLLREGRGKREARAYYNIEEKISVTKTSSDPESVLQSLNHILKGGDFDRMPERAEYVMGRVSGGEFRQIIEKLPDSYIKILSEDRRFQGFFLPLKVKEGQAVEVSEKKEEEGALETAKRKGFLKALPEIKKIPISIPVPSFFQKTRTVVQLNGVMEIGFLGIEHGAGTTFDAILCCNSLASDYRVAYLEMNKSGHMENYCRQVANPKDDTICFSYHGVDYYYHVPYMEFVVKYRSEYDFVVLDFGIWKKEEDFAPFIRTGKKFVVSGSGDWRMASLKAFHEYVSNHEILGEFTYLFSFVYAEQKEKLIREVVGGQPFEIIPAVQELECPQDEVKEMFLGHFLC